MTIDTSREAVERLARDHMTVSDCHKTYVMGHPHHWKTAQVLTALLAERDAALAEVARLSTPPDDAEVAALVKRLSGTPLYEGHGEASDAPDEAADALTRLSHAHAAERKLADDLEAALEEISTYDTGGTAGVAYTAKVALAVHAARRKE